MADGGCTNSTCTNSTCATCLPTCYSKQTFCIISGQSASDYFSHSWPASFEKDQIIYKVLPRTVFNTAFTYINNALHKGNTKATSSWMGTEETREFIFADKVSELIDGLSKFNNGCSIEKPNKNDVIYASYFTKISKALSNAQLSPSACDDCNVSCNVTCNSCQGCVNCQGCNSCQGHTSCHSPCHHPCHSPCDTPSTSTS
jgi:hypothetical protein